jgi:LPPG:FO 2-phospho-L-lactate transferase
MHLYRTERLRQGATLSGVTAEITAALAVRSRIVPMSDDRVRTRICTPAGELEFQTYFVKRRARDKVLDVRFEGASEATPAPGVIEAIAAAEAIVLCPSNPFISIAPILAIRGIREALRPKRERVLAISPIVGGRALKGPAAHMMKSMRLRPAAVEVARLYADFAGVFVLDEVDRKQAGDVEKLGMRPVVTNTVMRGLRERKALARVVLRKLELAS